MRFNSVSGLEISQMTLGTAQLGLNYGIANRTGGLTDLEAQNILHTAVMNQINSFDTAPAYGTSEERLGKFIRSHQIIGKQYPFVVATKISGLSDRINPNSESQIYQMIKTQILQSLHRLNQSSLVIAYLHKASDMNNPLVISALMKLHDEQLIDHVGVSVYSPEEVETFLTLPTMDAIQIPLNILDHRLLEGDLLNRLQNKRKIVFVRSIFLQGLFFLHSFPLHLKFAAPYIEKLHQIANDESISIHNLAISFVLNIPAITSIIIGIESISQLLENLKIFELPPLKNQIFQRIRNEFKKVPAKLINPSLWTT